MRCCGQLLLTRIWRQRSETAYVLQLSNATPLHSIPRQQNLRRPNENLSTRTQYGWYDGNSRHRADWTQWSYSFGDGGEKDDLNELRP